MSPPKYHNIPNSRPLREGVDRNSQLKKTLGLTVVALYARAWIEICSDLNLLSVSTSRPLREGVDRNRNRQLCRIIACGRPLREGVDRNACGQVLQCGIYVALYARAWIEMHPLHTDVCAHRVALYARAWIEMCTNLVPLYPGWSPSTRGRG